MSVNLTVKDCKNATVKTCEMFNGKFPYTVKNCIGHYIFGSEKEHIIYSYCNNSKLTFPEFPVLHFQLDAFLNNCVF